MSGCFYITVSPLVDDSMKKIQLEFQPKPADDDNADNASLGSIIHQGTYKCWNIPEIIDFVRRLGFASPTDRNESIHLFMELNEVRISGIYN